MPRPALSLLTQVSFVHLVSHVHFLAVPALLPLLPDALDVDFVELGLAVSLFNIASALCQAPMGFAVDRHGARRVLAAGLALGTAALFFLALFPSYFGLLAASTVMGVANAVYHPGDYAILSHSVKESVMGRAFSIHSFAGFCGSAATPALLTAVALWRGIPAAFAVTGLFGLAALAALGLAWPSEASHGHEAGAADSEDPAPGRRSPTNWKAMLSPVIFILILLYILLSLSTGSMERFSASALIQGYGAGLPLANGALTAFLVCTAAGVLSGGLLADRTKRHGYVAALAFGAASVATLITAFGGLPPFPLVAMFALIGFLTGVIVPSRDMLVRAASPKGGEGAVFGIVTTGFNIGGAVGPPMWGFFLDSGRPSWVFYSAALFMALTVALTWVQERRRAE